MIGGGREFVFTLGGDESGLVNASRRADSALKGTADATRRVAEEQRHAGSAAGNLFASLEMIAGIGGAGYFGSQLVSGAVGMSRALADAQINADRLMLQLSASVGPARAAQELEYVRGVSNRLGLELNSTAISYARFAAAARGTSMEGAGARQVFDAVSQAAAVMGLNVDETQGSLRALEQMMSKGTVQAEDLRGQLGDRLPGAMQIAARSMGVTTGRLSEMVQAGEVLAADFLPKFARQLEQELGSGATDAANRLGAATNRVSNSWELLKQDIAASGVGEFFKGQLNIAADALTSISEAYGRARDNGAGFVGQTFAGYVELQRFLLPFNAFSYSAASLENRLKAATERLAELQAGVERNPYDVYITKLRDDARELVVELERARNAKINLRAIDNAIFARTEKEAEEATTRRREALSKVTAELSGETSKLAKTLKVLDASRDAGDFGVVAGQAQYDMLRARAIREFGPKGGAKKDGENPLFKLEDEWSKRFESWRSKNEAALDRAESEAAAEEDRVMRFMLAQVQRSDERVMGITQRRSEEARAAIEQYGVAAEQVRASLLVDDEARARAMLVIDRAQVAARIAGMKLEGDERRRVEDAAAEYMLQREIQLTESLKPEWQRRLEEWTNATVLMRDTYNGLMDGFLSKGEDAFTEILQTGKLNTRSLVSFIGQEFAKLAYKRYVAPVLAGGLQSVLGAIFGGGGSGNGGTSGMDLWAEDLPKRAAGGGMQAGSIAQIVESGEPEVFTAAGGRRYLIAGSDGWVTPASAMSGARGSAAPTIVQQNTFNVPDGMSPAAYAVALEEFAQRLKADFAADLARPGRMLNRAALSAAS